ncbi:hypothetical protein [Piscinibacter koreensis]|uniref:Uncharacterized protein n=1 Tax=Piscinibacter koreensis TaxID=2742824 RepID=A0A7Y6TZE6_9BURK|nr:hypothetical protein [Schlegelella koreensis]NUZ09062.1 hypothetical protein [Schlegelella koreensis]
MKDSTFSAFAEENVTKKVSKNKNVPATEQNVLLLLKQLEQEGKPTHGPAIARASNGTITVSSIYKLLDRLATRGLVARAEVDVALGDITVKRVHYQTISSNHKVNQ